ncbi:MAG: TIGR04282 family arsenosugar biosynthesis glycosyltransferase [Gammaproteobacteria bacterium]
MTLPVLIRIFARAPVPGRCKTRLMRSRGASGAARVHRQLVRITVRQALASGLPVELWTAPDPGHAFFAALRRETGIVLRRQRSGDLGARMQHALRAGRPPGAATLIVGTDCPLLAPDLLRAAAACLEDHDAVLIPAEDGGYVLIGSRAPLKLRRIAWSSGREGRQTAGRIRRQGLRLQQLAPLWDVDHPRDLARARRAGYLP